MADLKCKRGNKFAIVGQARLTNDAGVTIPLTGWLISSAARQSVVTAGSTPPALSHLGTATWLVLDDGLYRVEWTAEQTNRWLPGSMKADIQLSHPIFGDINTDQFRILVADTVTK